MGRTTIEAVLRMSAEQVARPKEQGRRDADRELYRQGVHAARAALKEPQLLPLPGYLVTTPRLYPNASGAATRLDESSPKVPTAVFRFVLALVPPEERHHSPSIFLTPPRSSLRKSPPYPF